MVGILRGDAFVCCHMDVSRIRHAGDCRLHPGLFTRYRIRNSEIMYRTENPRKCCFSLKLCDTNCVLTIASSIWQQFTRVHVMNLVISWTTIHFHYSSFKTEFFVARYGCMLCCRCNVNLDTLDNIYDVIQHNITGTSIKICVLGKYNRVIGSMLLTLSAQYMS